MTKRCGSHVVLHTSASRLLFILRGRAGPPGTEATGVMDARPETVGPYSSAAPR